LFCIAQSAEQLLSIIARGFDVVVDNGAVTANEPAQALHLLSSVESNQIGRYRTRNLTDNSPKIACSEG
jgi:hypothetical protein